MTRSSRAGRGLAATPYTTHHTQHCATCAPLKKSCQPGAFLSSPAGSQILLQRIRRSRGSAPRKTRQTLGPGQICHQRSSGVTITTRRHDTPEWATFLPWHLANFHDHECPRHFLRPWVGIVSPSQRNSHRTNASPVLQLSQPRRGQHKREASGSHTVPPPSTERENVTSWSS